MKVDRKILISELRNRKKTYQEIAEILKITKQRVHQLYKDYKSTKIFVKEGILRRDRGKCLICDSRENLEVHHINGVKIDNRTANLATLCRECYKRIEKKERKAGLRSIEKKFGQKEAKKMIKRGCSFCGKEMEVKENSKQKFCSRKCFAWKEKSRKYQRDRYRKKLST